MVECRLVLDPANREPFATIHLPAVPRKGETLLVYDRDNASTFYDVQEVGYVGTEGEKSGAVLLQVRRR